MINYNLVNEYIQKLIKLGVTPDNVKTTYDNYNKSYIHYLTGEFISAGDPRVECVFTLINNKDTAIDINYIAQTIRKLGCTNEKHLYPATGYSTGITGRIDPFGIIGVYTDIRINYLWFVTTTGSRYQMTSLLADKIVEI